ncbi:SpaA isopeptide-forming pilin-related protein [Streptomyces sp. LE64]|uniref:SpaA isopeptide-forming pilin-related protein n=1 Tax=Streptomyces sp. LE64 TaxID=3448653 RepID=UPI00404296F0
MRTMSGRGAAYEESGATSPRGSSRRRRSALWAGLVTACAAVLPLMGLTVPAEAAPRATGTLRLCADRSVDGGPFSTGQTSTEQPLPPGHTTYMAVYDAGVTPGEFADEVYDGIAGVPTQRQVAANLDTADGLLDPSSPELYGGQLYEVHGGSCTDVVVDTAHTYYVVQYEREFDASGNLVGYRDLTQFGLGPDWSLGYWVDGGFPAGSHFDDSGLYVTPSGDRAYFSGGSGGYLGGRILPVTVDAGAVRKVTTITKHFSVTAVKELAPGTAGSVADRTILFTNKNLGGSVGGVGGVCCTAIYASRTGSDGTAYNTDPLAGWQLTAYEYISPEEWAAGYRLQSTTQDGVERPVAYVPVTQTLKDALLAWPYLQEYDRGLIEAVEVGGFFAGGGAILNDSNGGSYRAAPVTFTNNTGVVPPVTGAVTVVKEDDETGAALPGAVFELWQETNGVAGLQTGGGDPDTQVGLPCTTGTDGTCSTVVELGTYYWRETEAPDGYQLPAEPVFGPLVLTAANAAQGVTVTADDTAVPPTPVTGDVTVVKVDEETGTRLAGALFQLWEETNGVAGLQTTGADPDTRVGTPCLTDTRGECSRTVETGTYYWRETAAPEGYDLPAEPVFGPLVLTAANAAQGVTVTARDTAVPPTPVTGEVAVVKQDEETGTPLAGAVFELWEETNGVVGLQTSGADPDTRVNGSCTTGADGECSRTVETGTYYWRETAAPEGYDLPADPVGPLPLTQANAEEGVTVTAGNTRTPVPPTRGEVTVVKEDSVTGAALPGAVFRLWEETNGVPGLQTTGADSDSRVGASCTTPANGTCTRTVPLGTYYWQETRAPEGYDLPADPVFGPLILTAANADEGVTVVADNTETPVRGTIRLTKTDKKTGETLAGAVFELWRETNGVAGLQTGGGNPDTEVNSGCSTDGAGTCDFGDLPAGSYYLRETAVPEGYVLPSNPISGPYEITEADETVSVSLSNKRGESPKVSSP